MRVHLALLSGALVAAAIAAPAAAQDRHSGRMAETLADPALQHSMSTAIAAMAEAMLDMPVAPFARAMEAMGDPDARDIDPDATLADVAGPEARRMPREMARKLPRMMGAMGGMAGAMEAMLPQLEAMGRQMRDRIDEAEFD